MLAVLCDIKSDFFFTIFIFWGFGGKVVVAFKGNLCSLILISLLGYYSIIEVSLFLPVFKEEAWLEESIERSSLVK